MRPGVGLTVARPHAYAGNRSEPPMSLPWWMGPKPAAAAEPAPPDDPPGDASGCHGFRVRPCSGLSVVARIDSSGVFVRPTMIAPAFRRLRTSGASSGAITFANAGMPFGVGLPCWSTFSLIVIGTPCSGPRTRPAASASSARRASASASSV
jgi:hypothetical protein